MKHSKGSVHTDGCKGRLAQLEERLVCNQKAGGSNPPASTLPHFVERRGRFATPFVRKTRLRALAPASTLPLFVEGHGRSATGFLGCTQSILLAATDILPLNVNIRAEHNNRA